MSCPTNEQLGQTILVRYSLQCDETTKPVDFVLLGGVTNREFGTSITSVDVTTEQDMSKIGGAKSLDPTI